MAARNLVSASIPAALYTAAALLCTWPLATRMSTSLGAPIGPGDPFLNLWILGWGMRTTLADPAALVSGRVFDANIFHPAQGTLAYSDHLLLQSVVLAPLYGLTGSAVVCYNVLLVTSLVLSAWAMHAFIRDVTGSTGGAYLAGLAWGFGSYRFAHLLHLQLQALYFLPLTFLFLHRVFSGGRRRDALLLGLTVGVQAIASAYYGVIGGVGLAVGTIALVVIRRRHLPRGIVISLVSAVALAALLVAPIAVIYWRVQQGQGFGRGLDEAARHAATPGAYLQVPPGNVLYGRTGLLRPDEGAGAPQRPTAGPERELFPGFVLTALAAVGVWSGRRGRSRALSLSMLAVALVGFTLSLGPDGLRPLYAALHNHVLGFQAIRAPARFGVLTLFAVATLAALGWRALAVSAARRLPRYGRVLGMLVIVLAASEWLHLPEGLSPAPPTHTDAGDWLRRADGRGAVAVLPLTLDAEDTVAMVRSLEHGRPLLNGYSGHRPFHYTALVDALSTFPSDEALLALRESHVQYVVTRQPIAAVAPDELSPLVPRAVFPDAIVYELVWTPAIERRLAVRSVVVPPPPGVAPFTIGERARYAVSWEAAGADLTAGEISIAVEAPAYRFVVTATTAPWLKRFFEARDEYATQVDAALLPLLHTREQRHGWRHVRRAYVYDRADGTVRTGPSVGETSGPHAVTLPLAPDARDALATLFYVRTLPLDPPDRVAIPVNEAGRNLVVELDVVRHETVAVRGRQHAAIRVEPRIRQRIQRRRPPEATVWLSRDDRRVPLAFEVAAAFGRVRGELLEYDRHPPPR